MIPMCMATEGHSIPLPGLGTMRFGVRSKAVEKLEDVKANLISVRRIIFTPNVDVKDELKKSELPSSGSPDFCYMSSFYSSPPIGLSRVGLDSTVLSQLPHSVCLWKLVYS